MAAPDLSNTPFSSHVYIAAAKDNGTFGQLDQFITALTNHDLTICHSTSSDPEQIENDIVKSHTILFLATKEYFGHTQIPITFQAKCAAQKAEALSKKTVIVVKFPGAEEDHREIYETFFKKLPSRNYVSPHMSPVSGQMLTDECFLQDVVRLICEKSLRVPEVTSNHGACMAQCHYYAFLRHIIPAFKESVLTYPRDPADPGRLMCSKFIQVILVEECVPHDVSAKFPEITVKKTDHFKCTIDRAGQKKDLTPIIWEINIKGTSQVTRRYQCVSGFPSVLVNLDDMALDGKIQPKRKKWEIVQFYHYLNELIESDPKCRDSAVFIYHDESVKDCKPLSHILEEVIKNNIVESLQTEELIPGKGSPGSGSGSPGSNVSHSRSPSPGKDKGQVRSVRGDEGYVPPTAQGLAPVPSKVRCRFPVQVSIDLSESQSSGKVLCMNSLSDMDKQMKGHTDTIISALGLDDIPADRDRYQKMSSDDMQKLARQLFDGDELIDTRFLLGVVTMFGKDGSLYDDQHRDFSENNLTSFIAGSEHLKRKPKIFIIDPTRRCVDSPDARLTPSSALVGVEAASGIPPLSASPSAEVEGAGVFDNDILVVHISDSTFWEKFSEKVQGSQGQHLQSVIEELASEELCRYRGSLHTPVIIPMSANNGAAVP